MTTTVRTQRDCPACGRLIALYADGTFYAHKRLGRHCPGSHRGAA